MRTKTALLLAAFSAAGIATSTAQVFSVNAVGYVNKTVPANSFMMLSNPLRAATNTINALFGPFVQAGFTVYIYTPGTGYSIATYDDLSGDFGENGTKELLPGQGVFVRNTASTPATITFVGEVPQGQLDNPMVAGFQIVSSKVPQAGTPADLKFPHTAAEGLTAGDQVYKFNSATGQYAISTYDDLVDDFDNPVTFDVGEAVFVKLAKPVTWKRTFDVNNPTQ